MDLAMLTGPLLHWCCSVPGTVTYLLLLSVVQPDRKGFESWGFTMMPGFGSQPPLLTSLTCKYERVKDATANTTNRLLSMNHPAREPSDSTHEAFDDY